MADIYIPRLPGHESEPLDFANMSPTLVLSIVHSGKPNILGSDGVTGSKEVRDWNRDGRFPCSPAIFRHNGLAKHG